MPNPVMPNPVVPNPPVGPAVSDQEQNIAADPVLAYAPPTAHAAATGPLPTRSSHSSGGNGYTGQPGDRLSPSASNWHMQVRAHPGTCTHGSLTVLRMLGASGASPLPPITAHPPHPAPVRALPFHRSLASTHQ